VTQRMRTAGKSEAERHGHAGGRPAPTGWAIKRSESGAPVTEPSCICGAELSTCLGCGQIRCLACDPYLSDDCRWQL
jgi:hypothetical protein